VPGAPEHVDMFAIEHLRGRGTCGVGRVPAGTTSGGEWGRYVVWGPAVVHTEIWKPHRDVSSPSGVFRYFLRRHPVIITAGERAWHLRGHSIMGIRMREGNADGRILMCFSILGRRFRSDVDAFDLSVGLITGVIRPMIATPAEPLLGLTKAVLNHRIRLGKSSGRPAQRPQGTR
jgi:hypothetical protein